MDNEVNYTLKLKNIDLIKFTLVDTIYEVSGIIDHSYSLRISKVFTEHKDVFPKALDKELSNDTLLEWIIKRKAPKNRRFVNKILQAIDDDNNPMRYVDVSYALSLNDAFWIRNDLTNYKWEDVNLYEHPFDKVLANVAFTGYSRKIHGLTTSPEVTSKGAVKKCWSNKQDGIYLLKSDDFIKCEDGRSQSTLEYYAAQVAEAMNFEHIPYSLEYFKHHDNTKEIVCACKLFTSSDTGFVSASTFFREQNVDLSNSSVESIKGQQQLAELYGYDKYADLMVYDSLIYNRDRHMGNFGYLVDNNTGKFIKPAPIFDNGFSFFYGAASSELKEPKEFMRSIRAEFLDFDTQARLFVQKRHIPYLRKLTTFKFQRDELGALKESMVKIMDRMVNERASQMIEFYHQKEIAQKR